MFTAPSLVSLLPPRNSEGRPTTPPHRPKYPPRALNYQNAWMPSLHLQSNCINRWINWIDLRIECITRLLMTINLSIDCIYRLIHLKLDQANTISCSLKCEVPTGEIESIEKDLARKWSTVVWWFPEALEYGINIFKKQKQKIWRLPD